MGFWAHKREWGILEGIEVYNSVSIFSNIIGYLRGRQRVVGRKEERRRRIL
jgi:hypothetical protein